MRTQLLMPAARNQSAHDINAAKVSGWGTDSYQLSPEEPEGDTNNQPCSRVVACGAHMCGKGAGRTSNKAYHCHII